jgi:ribonucleoside-diphosphate reductase alpha chain
MVGLVIEKRNGEQTSFNPTKIQSRIKKASKGLNVNSDEIFIKTITSLKTEGLVKTKEIDDLISQISASYTATHYDYSKLAANISISNHHKATSDDFYTTMINLKNSNIINEKLINKIESLGVELINEYINYERDYIYDFFGWVSLKSMYLSKSSDELYMERPQHMYMRVAIWLNDTLEDIFDYYDSLSKQNISKATPIMINSGTNKPQLASCVLMQNVGDSRLELLETLKDISVYSSDAAGIGLGLSNIRSKESKISSSGGYAGGLLKYLKIVNESLRFFNQQGRRPGSAAIYLEPWHKDVFDLLDIKKNTGKEELRARDLFTALWIPDNFMRAVKDDDDWYLFCPNDISKAGLKPLHTIYGDEYEQEYNKAVELGIGKKIKAQKLWISIIESQIETGVPYLASKDNANKKSNHKNIGVLTQSNLCIEVFEYVNKDVTAICNLSSLVLKNFVNKKQFDYDILYKETRKIVRALNKVIDINHYSTERGRKGGLEQRAIGIGVQGLADTFYLMDLIFTSDEAKDVNKKIFETIYFAALTESNNLVKTGKYLPYEYFEGSPFSKGELQFHLWGLNEEDLSGMWDWSTLINDIKEYGVCNSLTTAMMPVASSAKITGSFEMVEPAHSAIFNRSVIGGEITIINKYLVKDLLELDVWNDDIKNEIIMNDGSIQNINFEKYLNKENKNFSKKVERILFLKQKYKTIWETSQKELINMARDRAPFIDQSQSMNIYFSSPTISKLTSSHFHAWESGLKTLSYYIRTKAISTGAKHLGIDVSEKTINTEFIEKPEDSPFDCFGCSA